MTTVYIVEDDPEVRASLQYVLRSNGLAVESYGSAESFLEAFDPEDAGCVLIDLRLPGMGGLELQRKLIRQGWLTPVIMLTGYGDVASAVGALEAGAAAFMQKPFEPAALLQRVNQVLDAHMRDRRAQTERAGAQGLVAALTPRQREVMKLMVAGLTTTDIAGRLEVSDRTAEAHRRQVLHRMGVESLAELVTLAVRFRLAEPANEVGGVPRTPPPRMA